MATGLQIPHVFSRRFLWAGYLIGFALGGFLDAILLHQFLQWHHLPSGLETAVARGRLEGDVPALAAAGAWHAACE
jgi:uncharacterized membrane protein